MIKNRKILFALALITTFIGCAYIVTTHKIIYSCSVNGQFLQYKDGIAVAEKDSAGKPIDFELAYYDYLPKFSIASSSKDFPAHQNAQIMLDDAKSSAVEKVFLYDQTDQKTKFRTVSSLVLNTTSGDIRLFHHYWIPPNQWQNSDLYTYTGYCLPKK